MNQPDALPLRTALGRGALVTLANWPVALVEFAIETLFQIALVVPIVGGAFMVAAVIGINIQDLLADGLRETTGRVVHSLTTTPAALAAFAGAVGLVAFGGSQILFLIKIGTLAVLVDAERHAHPQLGQAPVPGAFRSAARFDLSRLLGATRHFGRRGLVMGAWLAAIYSIGALLYLLAVGLGLAWPESIFARMWPLLVLLSTSATFVGVTVFHLAHDLLRIVVVTDDCSVREGLRRLRTFLLIDARQVIGIFAVMATVTVVAGGLALLGAGALTLVAWVPFAGVIALPLQLAAWLLRGLVFQALGLAGLCAYQAQYRRSLPSTGGAAGVGRIASTA